MFCWSFSVVFYSVVTLFNVKLCYILLVSPSLIVRKVKATFYTKQSLNLNCCWSIYICLLLLMPLFWEPFSAFAKYTSPISPTVYAYFNYTMLKHWNKALGATAWCNAVGAHDWCSQGPAVTLPLWMSRETPLFICRGLLCVQRPFQKLGEPEKQL